MGNLLSEEPGHLHPDRSKPLKRTVSIILLFFKLLLSGQVLPFSALCMRNGQEMMQLPKESRNLPAQPQFGSPHEIRAEDNRM